MSDASIVYLLQNVKEVFTYLKNKGKESENIISEARGGILVFESNLEAFRGFIQDSSNTPGNNEMQALTKRVQKVVDNASDVIDKFMIELARHSSRNRAKRLAYRRNHVKILRRISEDMRMINENVDRIYQQKMLRSELGVSVANDNRGSRYYVQASVAEQDDVVGFDEHAKEVMASLIGGSMKLDVISIVGMAGIGKTTLVKKVYDDATITSEFGYRVWVSASKDRPIKDVFISILEDLDKLENKNTNEAGPKDLENTFKPGEMVKKILQDKKYLIILDDVWTLKDWGYFRYSFPDNAKHSRILLTTQVKSVAENAHHNGIPYELNFLKDKVCWELVKKRVFLGNDCPIDLIECGKEIAKSCKGLPLAIEVIGSTLRRDPSNMKSNWEKVVCRVNEFIVEKESRFAEVVSLRVNKLSCNLKVCFLYFGLIPRGPIPVWKLIRLWIAEGFIEDESTLGLEHTAAKWLGDLVDLNLVIATSREFDGETKTCHVHDSFHAFCKKEAEAQNLYRVIHMSNFDSLVNSSRVCVNSEVVKHLSSISAGEHVRTFLTYPEEINLKPKELEKMLGAFKGIRILDVSFIKANRFPKVLKENRLLKFLSFSCDFDVIPSSISRLWSLETLIILKSNNTGKIIFDEKFWKLCNLRHLQTNASIVLPRPRANQKLDKLQTLCPIAPETCMKELFLKTPKVQKLGVKGNLAALLENDSTLIENFEELKYLKYLKLLNDGSVILNLIPKLGQILKNLRKLTLSDTTLSWEHIAVLGDLEMLEALKLKNNAFKGSTWTVTDGSFQKLTFLKIDTADLKTWEADKDQFRSISHLVLKDCKQLAALPKCLEYLRSFKTLDIRTCSGKVEQSARDLKITRGSLNLPINSSIV